MDSDRSTLVTPLAPLSKTLLASCLQGMLAAAAAQWARYRRDVTAACHELMTARTWGQAHQLLAIHVAPSLMVAGR
jgi:hypothetical protein